MQLFYREYGEGKPIIIAHGLFAMSDNWVRVAKQLSKKNKVYVLDLRNHGQSPKDEIHTYEAISQDFNEFMNNLNIKKAIFIGHSMGGKAVMQFVNNYPEKVEKMIIVDVSPKAYVHDDEFVKKTINHKLLLEILQKANLNNFKNRKEIINYFSDFFNDIFILQLIQKNIRKNKDGNFEWKINVEVLYSNLNEIVREVVLSKIVNDIASLFIFGGHSPYYKKGDIEQIQKTLKNVKLKIIENAEHLLHIEKEIEFISIINDFIY